MKKLAFILAIAICSAALPSCDLVRKIAGRPNSDVVELYRQREIAGKMLADSLAALEKAKAEAARLDSLAAVRDSLAALDTLSGMNVIFNRRSEMKNFADVAMPAHYVIIAGVYGKKYNAERALNSFASANVSPVSFTGVSGLAAVGICPSDKVKDICRAFVSNSGILPSDAWILVDE